MILAASKPSGSNRSAVPGGLPIFNAATTRFVRIGKTWALTAPGVFRQLRRYAFRVEADVAEGFQRSMRGRPLFFERIDGVPSLQMLTKAMP